MVPVLLRPPEIERYQGEPEALLDPLRRGGTSIRRAENHRVQGCRRGATPKAPSSRPLLAPTLLHLLLLDSFVSLHPAEGRRCSAIGCSSLGSATATDSCLSRDGVQFRRIGREGPPGRGAALPVCQPSTLSSDKGLRNRRDDDHVPGVGSTLSTQMTVSSSALASHHLCSRKQIHEPGDHDLQRKPKEWRSTVREQGHQAPRPRMHIPRCDSPLGAVAMPRHGQVGQFPQVLQPPFGNSHCCVCPGMGWGGMMRWCGA